MIAIHEEIREVDDAWVCQRCGGTDWCVSDSRFDGTKRRRQRECKVCHSTLTTIELPQPEGFTVRALPNG